MRTRPFNIQHLTFNIPRSYAFNYEDLTPVKKSIEVEIPADLISNEAKACDHRIHAAGEPSGFRPGKVPLRSCDTGSPKRFRMR